jgi:hypothetical protein
MFFQSLLDSAVDLPDLRRLTLQAILNIPWRDRASFRDKWVGSLDRVFKRVSSPPEKNESLRPQDAAMNVPAQPKDSEQSRVTTQKRKPLRSTSVSSSSSLTSLSSSSERAEEAASPPSRRSTRTSARQIQTGTYAESSDSSDEGTKPEKPSSRHAARSARASRELAILKQTAGRDLLPSSSSQTDENDSADDDEPLVKRYQGKGKATEVVQGMCEIVNVRIDNLRPAETQVTEADFLDEEAPGDNDFVPGAHEDD